MHRLRWNGTCFGTIALATLAGAPARAHGFGQRYDLPLPLPLYLLGAAAAVVLSFVIVALFARARPATRDNPRADIPAGPAARIIGNGFVFALRFCSVALFTATLAAAFIGDQNPYRNFAPTFVWIIFWVGLTIVSAFAGGLWAVMNPWEIVFGRAERLYATIMGRRLTARLTWPQMLGAWPAVGLMLGVSWTELVFPAPAVPLNIAWMILLYSALTWTGMAVFGREIWLRHGEVFSVYFGLFARFAPIEPVGSGGRRGLTLRPFGTGLLTTEPASTSMVAFVLLMLSSVLYDGLLSTPEWAELEHWIGVPPLAAGLGSIIVRSAGLVTFWALFLGAYLAVTGAMSRLAPTHSPLNLAKNFAFTLVPIAIGYHVAHGLVYLLIQGQYIVPLASDPFGYGWNLFGTAGYRVDIGLVGARFAWYVAVASIVLGHIAAVWLADVRAHRLLPARRAAVRAQVPLTALMVVYTVVSLSILAEPLVQRPAPARPTAVAAEGWRIPDDAVVPEPGTGRLRPAGPGLRATTRLTYSLLGSAFHDGTRTTAADLLYATMFAWRWASRDDTGSHYDPAIAAATEPMRRRLIAIRVGGVDTTTRSFRVGDMNFVRELFVIDVYANIATQDPEQDAIFTPPWSTLPWHLLVLMEAAVERGWAAFSQAEAERRGIPWLDLVRSDPLKARLTAVLSEFERTSYRPEILEQLVTAEDARARWAALAAFFREHGHFLVTNGPYRLKSWSDDRATVEAFRDLSYPLGVGSYDVYAIPRRGFVTRVERDEGGLRLFADIETVMKFMRDYRLVRQPMQTADALVLRRAAPECRYTVVNDEARVALAGTERPLDNQTFRIELESRLAPGRYMVLAEIVVNGNAMNTAIERIPVIIGAGR